MSIENFDTSEINIKPTYVHFYMPPIVWKGDPIGHIGSNDTFFWLLEGELILSIDAEHYLLKAGQMAFLPKNKLRKYTTISKDFSLYTMSFHAEASGSNLMQGLGLSDGNYVVTIEDCSSMNRLFESSSRIEMHKDPINNVIWSANILNIIKLYASARKEQSTNKDSRFLPVIEYMKNHMDRSVTINELADIVHMQPTYFIRRFKQLYGLAPAAYLKNFRVHKAMEMLLNTQISIEEVAADLGMGDCAYFSRWFKKNCGISPSEYRKRVYENK